MHMFFFWYLCHDLQYLLDISLKIAWMLRISSIGTSWISYKPYSIKLDHHKIDHTKEWSWHMQPWHMRAIWGWNLELTRYHISWNYRRCYLSLLQKRNAHCVWCRLFSGDDQKTLAIRGVLASTCSRCGGTVKWQDLKGEISQPEA